MADPNIAYWRGVLKAAEAELDAATTRDALNAAARRLMTAKAELKRLGYEALGEPSPDRR